MRDADLVALSDAGYHALEREIVARSGGRVEEVDGLLFTAAPDNPAPFIVNGMVRLDRSISPADTIARGKAYYAQLGRPAGISTHGDESDLDAALRNDGWELVVELPGMIAVEPITAATPGLGIELVHAQTDSDLARLKSVLTRSFGPEDPWPSIFETLFPSLDAIIASHVTAVIATVAGEPAACAVGYALDPVGVVGFVGTLPEFGRRGLGELVTRQVAAEIHAMTGRPVVLQSSPQGLGLYGRIGFETVTTYRVWSSAPT